MLLLWSLFLFLKVFFSAVLVLLDVTSEQTTDTDNKRREPCVYFIEGAVASVGQVRLTGDGAAERLACCPFK